MLVYQCKNSQDGLDNMNKEEIEEGMKCCNEFLCGECPYEKYDDKVSHQYTMRCIHMLMQDINKLYFEEETNK